MFVLMYMNYIFQWMFSLQTIGFFIHQSSNKPFANDHVMWTFSNFQSFKLGLQISIVQSFNVWQCCEGVSVTFWRWYAVIPVLHNKIDCWNCNEIKIILIERPENLPPRNTHLSQLIIIHITTLMLEFLHQTFDHPEPHRLQYFPRVVLFQRSGDENNLFWNHLMSGHTRKTRA